MTITINIPDTLEGRLRDESLRAGITVPHLLEQIVLERFDIQNGDNSIQALFDGIARPAPEIYVSREGIYVDS